MSHPDIQLESEWRSWIRSHEQRDPADLALELSGKKGYPTAFLLNQIKGRRVAKVKMPAWYQTDGVIFPDTLILEQCSSQVTAKYKADHFPAKKLADLTGGLGVDAAARTGSMEALLFVEPDNQRCAIAGHNLALLGISTLQLMQSKAEDALEQVKTFEPDLIYLDPSRRGENKQRVFRISDLQPDVLQLKAQLLRMAPRVLIKFGPMLDISEALRQIPETAEIHILSWKGECRELLFLLTSKPTDSVHIQAIELEDNNLPFVCNRTELSGLPERSAPLKYLYEPSAAVSKSGAWKALATNTGVKALHENTHLFTSDKKVAFPGRCFEILELLPYDADVIKAALPIPQAQLVFRNFPVPADQVIKKLKIPSGEPYYLFFVTINTGEAKVILSRRT